MGLQDTAKHMGVLLPFLVRDYLGRHKAEHLLPNTDKSQMLLYESWRFCLSTLAPICVFKHQYHKYRHSSGSLAHSSHLSLSPSGSWCTPDFGWGHLLPSGTSRPLSWPLSFGVLQSSPVWFGVSQGTAGGGRKGVCTDLISESRLKSALHWTTWADFGCQKELYPTALLLWMFFSLLAKHISLLWPHYPKIFNV